MRYKIQLLSVVALSCLLNSGIGYASTPTVWQQYAQQADIPKKEGNDKDSEKKLRQALSAARASGNSKKIRTSLIDLAAFLYDKGKFQQATPYLKQSAAAQQKYFNQISLSNKSKPEDLDSANVLLCKQLSMLGECYRANGIYRNTIFYYQKALKVDSLNKSPHDFNTAKMKDGLGDVYLVQGRYKEAEPLYKDAINKFKKIGPPAADNLIEILQDYTTLLRESGRTDEALKIEADMHQLRQARTSDTQNKEARSQP